MSTVLRKMTSAEFEVFYREGIKQHTQELTEELHLTYQLAHFFLAGIRSAIHYPL